jgi:hypothetical protein
VLQVDTCTAERYSPHQIHKAAYSEGASTCPEQYIQIGQGSQPYRPQKMVHRLSQCVCSFSTLPAAFCKPGSNGHGPVKPVAIEAELLCWATI